MKIARLASPIPFVLLFACGANGQPEAKSKALLDVAPEQVRAPVEKEPVRIDLRKSDPPFPATLILPEGTSVKTQWRRKSDYSGFFYDYVDASIELGEGQSMSIGRREFVTTSSSISKSKKRREKGARS